MRETENFIRDKLAFHKQRLRVGESELSGVDKTLAKLLRALMLGEMTE